ncbi:MAG: DUF1080 domain-containing protein [Verrucomicrobiales bacterium]|nr:DUF1080 domain-containing protein [Verrucomicrobiales bacterium]
MMKSPIFSLVLLFVFASTTGLAQQDKKAKGKGKAAKSAPKQQPTGYTDTPMLPDGKWRVHDDNRPRPKVVKPGKTAADPPADAIVLFDGKNLDEWVMEKNDSPADWIVKDGFMEVPPKGEGVGGYIKTKRNFKDVQLHVEWATPEKVEGNSQGRGNSGVFLLGGYEIQVLDSFENKSYADGQASALYGWKPPLVNASRKPGEWQTYDIIFEAPRWDDEGKLVKKAYVTVIHNGVLTHHRQEYLGPTGHKRVANYDKKLDEGPIKLQNHSNPTRFRNIWVRELDLDAND